MAENSQSQLAPFRKLFSFINKCDVLLIMLGSSAATVMGIIQPLLFLFMAEMFNSVDEERPAEDFYDDVVGLSTLMLYSGLAFLVAGYIAIAAWVAVGARQGYSFRAAYFSKILSQDAEWFDGRAVAELPTSLMNDTLKIERATGDKLVILIFTFTMILASAVIALFTSVKLTLIALALGPLMIIGLTLTNNGLEQNAKASDLSYKRAGGIAEEALQEIKTVAALNGQKHEVRKFLEFLQENTKSLFMNGFKQGLGIGLAIFSFLTMMAVLFYVGAHDIRDGEENWLDGEDHDVGKVVTVAFIAILAFNNISTLVPALKILNEGRIAAAAVLEVLATHSQVLSGHCEDAIQGRIRFKSVHFAYPSSPAVTVLKGVSFKVAAGQRLGVVGSTGSGKSTIVQLLMNFYSVNSGQITIDGRPLQEYSASFLRSHIGLVSQEPLLFNTGIYENIQYGKLDATENEIQKAAEKAGALEFIERLPEQFQTTVGAKGSQLSGGQKQRIALARAIIREPKLLLLDEATSALDRQTELSVLESLQSALPESTWISVAQNLLTLKGSSKIIVLAEGVVVEEGTHEELMAFKGKYYHLFKMQEIQQHNWTEYDVESCAESEHSKSVETPTQPQEKSSKYFRRVFRMNKKSKHWLALGASGSLLVGLVYPLTGALLGLQVYNLASRSGDDLTDKSLLFSAFTVLFATVSLAGLVVESVSYPRMSSDLTAQLRELSFRSLLNHDAGFFDLPENNSTALTVQLSNNCEKVSGLSGSLFGILVGIVSSLIVAHGVAAWFSWQISLMVLVLVPVLLFSVAAGFMAQMEGVVKHSYIDCGALAADAIFNYKTVKAYGLNTALSEKYLFPATMEKKTTLKKGHVAGITYGAGFGVLFWAYALIFWFGAWLVREGEVGFEDMLVATLAAIVGSDAFFIAGVYISDVKGGLGAAQSVFQLIDYVPKIDVRDKTGETVHVQGHFRFENVTFAYPNREYKALKSLDFSIEPGTKLAVIGRTGSGKSTVIQLLLRLYDPSSGAIYLDNIDLRHFQLKHLRNQIGLVSQEPVLFSGTVAENIAHGSKGGDSQKEIERAARLAQATEFIVKHPLGFSREVGLKGSQLSGGQKQRIAIARALIRSPKILILDEATSALDAETEDAVMNSLTSELAEATWFMIAHRLRTVASAGSILVLEAGRLLEFGTREELYDQGGYFHSMLSSLSN